MGKINKIFLYECILHLIAIVSLIISYKLSLWWLIITMFTIKRLYVLHVLKKIARENNISLTELINQIKRKN